MCFVSSFSSSFFKEFFNDLRKIKERASVRIPLVSAKEIPERREFCVSLAQTCFRLKGGTRGRVLGAGGQEPVKETWASSVPLGLTDYDTYYITYDGSAMKTKCI